MAGACYLFVSNGSAQTASSHHILYPLLSQNFFTVLWQSVSLLDTQHIILISAIHLKRPCIEFGVVQIDSAIVVCIHSAIIQLLLTRRVSYY